MLVSLVLQLQASRQEPVLGLSGQLVHGWFLKLVERHDLGLAAELHPDRRHKPFTLSPLQPMVTPGGNTGEAANRRSYWLRITSVAKPLSDLLLGLEAEGIGSVRLGGTEFEISQVAREASEHPWAGTGNFADIWGRWMSGDHLPGRVRLRFVSPTAFEARKKTGNTLFPLPDQVSRSLWEKWNEHAPHRLTDGVLKELGHLTRVEAHHLRTEAVKFKGSNGKDFTEKGFVGWCEFSVGRDGSPDAHRALHLLADFAFYAGVGLKTTMGMGQAVALSRLTPQAPLRAATAR